MNHAVDLNSFYGYAPAINRTTGVRGPVRDRSVVHLRRGDAAFFVVVLTLEVVPTTGAFTTREPPRPRGQPDGRTRPAVEHLPLDVTNDGTEHRRRVQRAGPCLGDYPHIGADANGFYVTTNAYPWCCNGFNGAQIYAFSKAAARGRCGDRDDGAHRHVRNGQRAERCRSTQPGFTVWPAQSPGTSSFNISDGGTEYFLSSNAADEATHSGGRHRRQLHVDQIVVWTLTNTSSLNSASPTSDPQQQGAERGPVRRFRRSSSSRAPGRSPSTDCRRATASTTRRRPRSQGVGCWRLLFARRAGAQRGHLDADSNDTRMQQVMYANGKLWGALDTAVNPSAAPKRAGIAYYVVNPSAGKVVSRATSGRRVRLHVPGDRRHRRAAAASWRSPYTGDTLNPERRVRADRRARRRRRRGHRGHRRRRVPPATTASRATSHRSATRRAPAGATTARLPWTATRSGSPASTSRSACDYTDVGRPVLRRRHRRQPAGHVRAAPATGPVPRAALGNWSTRISKLTP